AGKTEVRIHITAELRAEAPRIVGVTRAHCAAAISQFANRPEMVAGIIERTGVRPGCELNTLAEESFGDCAVVIAFFADPAAIPNKQPVRHFGTIQQLSNSYHAALAIIRELGPLVSGIHRNQPICAIPFIGARTSGCGGSAELIQGIVGGG